MMASLLSKALPGSTKDPELGPGHLPCLERPEGNKELSAVMDSSSVSVISSQEGALNS